MPYTPTNWRAGDIITGTKMNKIEEQLVANTEEIEAARGLGDSASGTLGARLDDMIIASATEPSSVDNEIWLDTSDSPSHTVPEINDSAISTNDTWSSQKINEEVSAKISIAQGVAHAGEALIVGQDGNVITSESGMSIDTTLTIAGKAADAKATGDKIDELKSAFDDSIASIGVASKKYNQTAGTGHTSNSDKVLINAKAGDTIAIEVTTDVDGAISGTIQYYGYYTDGTSSRLSLTSNMSITATLEKDLNAIGLYYASDRAIKNSIVTVVVKVLSNDTYYGEFNGFKKTQAEYNETMQADMDAVRAIKLPLGNLVANSYVETTGVITAYNNWSRTDYLEVSALAEIRATSSVTSKYNCFYDSSKQFISSFYVRTTVEKVPVPSNAKYVIFSNTNTGMSTLEVAYSEKFTGKTEMVQNTITGVYCDTDITDQLLDYGEMVADSGEADTFLFFTDPHLFYGIFPGEDEDWLNRIYDRMPLVQKAYNSTPTSFCLCGGDWLSNNDTPAQAGAKLGYITGIMKNMFNRYYMMCGNHDTNYQGTERILNPALINLMFNDIGTMYYTFKNPYSRFYVFDTAIDTDHSMGSYRWAQIGWFANALIENDDAHSVIALHIVTNQTKEAFEESPVYHEFADNITLVAQAYNAKTSVTLNSVTYDFSETSGTVEFAIAGHSHFDEITELNDIPVMITDWLRDGDSATFDLVLADYTNHVVKTVRIGSGDNRTMNMASATE